MNLRHLFKIIWNRRKMNSLMIIEIFFSFLVLFILVQTLSKTALNYSKPLGYNYENVWALSLNTYALPPEKARATIDQLINILYEFPEIEKVTETYCIPFQSTNRIYDFEHNNINYRANCIGADDDYQDVMGIKLLSGRWFNKSDNSEFAEPIIIDIKLASKLFPEKNALNNKFDIEGKPYRVIGLIDNFQKNGELRNFDNFFFKRIHSGTPDSENGTFLLIKVKPGSDAVTEHKVMRKLSNFSKNITFTMKQLEEMHRANLTKFIYPVSILGFVSIFLIINVSLGLFGVLWYNINFRKSELGIRRAVGSTRKKIYSLVIGETLTLTTFGVILSSFLVFQLRLFNLENFITPLIFNISYIITILSIYSLTTLCALYPSKLAADIEPAEALHDE